MSEPSQKKVRPEDALHSLSQGPKGDPQSALLAQLANKQQQPLRESDLAAVLDAKAFKPRLGKEDALQAMANGEWKDEQPPAPAGQDSDPGGQEDRADILEGGAVSGPSRVATGSRSGSAARATIYGSGVKKFFVPPLLAAGGLLWVLGGLVGYMSSVGRLGPSTTLRTLMIVSAFPLGAFLMLGAWLFHNESRQR
jgi:hypothetical protein